MITANNLIDFFVNPLGWDKDFYRFDRFEKDMNPYSIKDDKEKGIITISHNILGIDKKDLKVQVIPENNKKYLVISGKTVDEITKKEYSINSRFYISDELDVEGIKSTAKNGLVYITIPYKKEVVDKNQTITINVE